jgi:hypothetical protein
MCQPLSAVSIHQDIQLFKKSRAIDYLGALQIITQKEMRILDLYGQMLFTLSPETHPKQALDPSILL